MRNVSKETTNNRVYKILTSKPNWLDIDCCCLCPMDDHCKNGKRCKPNRLRERNWKSQRKKQWK